MAVLRPYLIGRAHPNGDWDARCPLHDDKKRSCRINFDKAVWKCFAGCGGGRLSSLLKRMGEFRSNGGTKAGDEKPVDPKEVVRWHRALMKNEEAQDLLWYTRYIRIPTIQRFKLGWDVTSAAFTIPIYDEEGGLVNARKYRPMAPADRKIFWAWKKQPDMVLPIYPADILDQVDWVVLAEGEMDALVALQHGIPAVTGTAGAGTWHVNWSPLFQDKHVFIAYDRDKTGENAARQVAEHLEPYAQSIYIVTIPIEKKGADISDFFFDGKEAEDFKEVLRGSERYAKRIQDPSKLEPIPVSVLTSFDAQNVGRAMELDVHIAGRRNPPYTLPKVVHSVCTMDAGPKCNVCPMLAREGDYTFEVPPWSPRVLNMAGNSRRELNEALRQENGAVKCDRLRHEVLSHQSVEELYVRPSWDVDTGDFTNRKIYGVGKHDTLPSQTVRLTGTAWPDPREQRNQFLAWDVRAVESAIEEFRVTPDIRSQLSIFQPTSEETPLRKLWEVAGDLEGNVTRIYGRRDLHLTIMLVYHSIISFPFLGQLERRGWLDALVIGDTRTGKSEASLKMSQHYRAGKVVNCEAATFAGIVGGLQQIGANNREWTVTWGMIPMNDQRLVILDEASGLSHDAIQQMSDIRSRGEITLQKVQQEHAWARTRLLWLSNPRDESMERYTYGVQAIAPLIGNREDIARFDFAMALTSDDVSLDQIHRPTKLREPYYSSEDSHMLILWAWSRRPEDVVWKNGAEQDVRTAAEWLGDRYTPDPPLIQAANVRLKIARLAAAIAAATFSSDSSGRKLVITRDHVADALRFLHGLYKRETFGYYRMSERHRVQQNKAIAYMDEAKRYLSDNPALVQFLLSVEGSFRREMLEQTLDYRREEANAIVNKLFNWGLVSPDTQAVRLSPILHQLLREMEST